MQPDLPLNLLFVVVPAIVALSLWAPLYVLLLVDLGTVIFPNQWQLFQVHFDITDLIFAGFGLALLLGRGVARPERKIPYLAIWVCFGIIRSWAYATAPINAHYFFDAPNAIDVALSYIYQVYRYCWRPILLYPLAALLLGSRKKLEVTLAVIVLCGAVCAVMAFSQGYAGMEATGPFETKNQLGGALIIPFLLALGGLLYAASVRLRGFFGICVLLMARGLLFAGSRGAFVAVLGGVVFFTAWLWTRAHGRVRIIRLAVGAATLTLVVIGLKPGVLQRPNVRHFLTTSEGTEAGTMQWRIKDRWPFFWHKALTHFWLGTGTDTDPSLGDSAITPHNGYLGIAVISGIPSILLLLGLSLLGVYNGLRLFLHAKDPWQSSIGVVLATALVSFLIHNMVDETFQLPFAQNSLWILIATATAVRRRPADFLPERIQTHVSATQTKGAAPIGAVGVTS